MGDVVGEVVDDTLAELVVYATGTDETPQEVGAVRRGVSNVPAVVVFMLHTCICSLTSMVELSIIVGGPEAASIGNAAWVS